SDLVVVRRLAEGQDQDERQDEGDEEVHGGAGGGHDDPLVERLIAVGPRLVLPRHLLGGGEPDDAHVAAGGNGLHAVFGLTPAYRPQARPEADEVLRHLHAGPLGRDEVAELVQHHDGEEDGDEEEQVAPAHDDEDGRDQDQGHHQLEHARRAAVRLRIRLEGRLRRRRLLLGERHRRYNATGRHPGPGVGPGPGGPWTWPRRRRRAPLRPGPPARPPSPPWSRPPRRRWRPRAARCRGTPRRPPRWPR